MTFWISFVVTPSTERKISITLPSFPFFRMCTIEGGSKHLMSCRASYSRPFTSILNPSIPHSDKSSRMSPLILFGKNLKCSDAVVWYVSQIELKNMTLNWNNIIFVSWLKVGSRGSWNADRISWSIMSKVIFHFLPEIHLKISVNFHKIRILIFAVSSKTNFINYTNFWKRYPKNMTTTNLKLSILLNELWLWRSKRINKVLFLSIFCINKLLRRYLI